MYEKDGEKYFVFDSHLHFWDASPENWVKGDEEYAKGWIECFHAYMGLGAAGDALDARALPEVLGRGLREGRVRGRPRRHGGLPVDVPEGVVHERVQRHRAERRAARPLPGQADRQRPLGPARGRGRAAPARGRPREVRHPGRQALHGRVDKRLARLEADRPRGGAVPRQVRRARDQEHPRPQGADDLAAGQGRLRRLRHRPRGDGLPGPQLHRRARRAAADRGLLLHGDAGAQRLRRPRRRRSAA